MDISSTSHIRTPNMPAFGTDDGIGEVVWLEKSMENGSITNNSFMKMPTHTGTHLDAPRHIFDHYFDPGFYVETLDLQLLNGNYLSNLLLIGARKSGTKRIFCPTMIRFRMKITNYDNFYIYKNIIN